MGPHRRLPVLEPARAPLELAIDDTRETGAVVPAEFLRVQWTRLPGALPTAQFVVQVKRLLDATGEAVLLEDQDRSAWRAPMIAEGLALIDKAMRHRQPSPYLVQAAIAALARVQVALLSARAVPLEPKVNRARDFGLLIYCLVVVGLLVAVGHVLEAVHVVDRLGGGLQPGALIRAR